MKKMWFGVLALALVLGCGSSSDSGNVDATDGSSDTSLADQSSSDGGPQSGIVSVTLTVDPQEDLYKVGDEVTFSWVGVDVDGNEIQDLSGTLDVPAEGLSAVDEATHSYAFLADGIWTVTVNLDGDNSGISASLDLMVDGTGPEIIVTSPERGATLEGAGVPVTISGTVTDAVGTVSSILLNEVEVKLGENGEFSELMTPVWGVNIIKIEAVDSNGNSAKRTPSFQYSRGYTSFEQTNAEGLKIEDGLQIMLGDPFLDDGDHDPNDINDMATLLEVILSNLDIETLINDSLTGLSGSQTLADIAGFETIFEYSLQVVPPTEMGPTRVTLDSVEGGIDVFVEIGDETEAGIHLTLAVPATLKVKAPLVGVIGTTTFTLNTGITVDKMKFSALIEMSKDPSGPLTADLEDLDLDLENVQLDPIEDVTVNVNITPPFLPPFTWTGALSDLVNLNNLTDTILDPVLDLVVDALLDVIEPTLEFFAGDVLAVVLESLEIDETLNIPNLFNPDGPSIDIDYYTSLSSVQFTDPGGQLGMSFGSYSEKNVTRTPLGSIQRQACLTESPTEFNYSWAEEFALALKMDSLNGLLYAMWQSGALNGPADLDALIGDAAPIPLDGLTMNTDFYLAPILNDCKDGEGATIQIGDLKLQLDGSLLGIKLDALTFVDMTLTATFESDTDGLYIKIGELQEFDIEVIEVGPDSDPTVVKALLEEQLPGLLGGLLTGEGFGPIELPGIDLSEIAPGVPPGSVLEFVPTSIDGDKGHLILEGKLD